MKTNITKFIPRTALALVLMMLTTATAWAQEKISGLTYNTTGGYYEISDAQDLVDLATYVNNTESTSGKTFKQTADIDMSSISNFARIGTGGNKTFMGTYDGQGHAISGLNVSASDGNIGLFGRIEGATVRNVLLVSPTATATTTRSSDLVYLGALIGRCSSDGTNTVENCVVVSPTLSSSSTGSVNYIGAIIGQIWGSTTTVRNCYYYDNAHDYALVGYVTSSHLTNVARARRITLGSGITAVSPAASDPASGFQYGGSDYYREGLALTLTHPVGWIYAYSVNGTDIDGNTFTMPASDATITATFAPDPAHFSQQGDTYTIHTAAGWDVFCDMLADNNKGIFDGKTIALGANIEVSRMAGGSYHDFTGTFDGQGHTLTLNYGTAESPIDAQFVAPFLLTENNGDSKPTFRNLTIDGHIYEAYSGSEAHNVGGLIGHLYGTVTIEHCTSNVTITSTGGAGGFVSLCENAVSFTDCMSSAIIHSTGGNNSGFVGWSRSTNYAINFEGCLFNGKLLQVGGSGNSNGGFIGWKGDAKKVSITNCLVAPTALADGETLADEGSATFSREHATYAATITNSYYTRALGTAQGKQARTVSVADGESVTVAVSPVGDATQTYTVSGITAYEHGIQRGQTLYYGEGDPVTLALSNTASAPLGYRYADYTASHDGSIALVDGSTLTMPDADVTISLNTSHPRSTGETVSVSYVTPDCTEPLTANAIALDGYETVTTEFGSKYIDLAAGWYYVGTDITYTNVKIRPQGAVNIILGNGKTMHIGTADNPTGLTGIQAPTENLTIYGQSLDNATAGALSYVGTGAYGIEVSNYTQHSGNVSISNSPFMGIGINVNSVTIKGGTLTVATNADGAKAILANGDITISGGTVDARATGSGDLCGIHSNYGTITLGWTSLDDRITASSYSGTIKVATGKTLTDGDGNILTGTLAPADVNGKTLRPCLMGDVNGDDTLTIADVTALVNIVLGKGTNVVTADVNLDGQVSIADVTALVNKVLGK